MNKNTIACAALLAVFTLGASPLMAAEAAPAAAQTEAKPAKAHKATKTAAPAAKAVGGRSRGDLKACITENTAVAKAYCANHPGAGCDTEMKAVEKECKDEASGKPMKG